MGAGVYAHMYGQLEFAPPVGRHQLHPQGARVVSREVWIVVMRCERLGYPITAELPVSPAVIRNWTLPDSFYLLLL